MLFARLASNSCRGIYGLKPSVTNAWAGIAPSMGAGNNSMSYDASGNIYVLDNVPSIGYSIYKFDIGGNFIYEKQVSLGISITTSSCQVVDGYVYVSGVYGNLGSRAIVVTKHNISDGTIVWSKRLTSIVSYDANASDMVYDTTNNRIYCIASQSNVLYVHTLDSNGSIFANIATISGSSISEALCLNGALYLKQGTSILKVNIGINGLVSSISPFSFTLGVVGGSSRSVDRLGPMIFSPYQGYGSTDALVIGYTAFNSTLSRYELAIAGFDLSSTITTLGTRVYTGYSGNGTTTAIYYPQGITWDGSSIYMTTNQSLSPSTYRMNTLKIDSATTALSSGNRLSSATSTGGLSGQGLKVLNDNLTMGSNNNLWALPKDGTVPGTGSYTIGGVTYTYIVSTLTGTATPTMTKTTSTRTTGSTSGSSSNLSLTVTDGTGTYTRTGL